MTFILSLSNCGGSSYIRWIIVLENYVLSFGLQSLLGISDNTKQNEQRKKCYILTQETKIVFAEDRDSHTQKKLCIH